MKGEFKTFRLIFVVLVALAILRVLAFGLFGI